MVVCRRRVELEYVFDRLGERTKEPSLLQGLVVCRSYSYYRTSARTKRRKRYYHYCVTKSHESPVPGGFPRFYRPDCVLSENPQPHGFLRFMTQ
jgi:hypothetical protein